MARKTPVQTTGNTPFSGTQYTEYLATRQIAMAGFAEGTVSAEDKAAARTVVRQARKAIAATGLTVKAWREAELVRENEAAEAKRAARSQRSPKAEPAESVPAA